MSLITSLIGTPSKLERGWRPNIWASFYFSSLKKCFLLIVYSSYLNIRKSSKCKSEIKNSVSVGFDCKTLWNEIVLGNILWYSWVLVGMLRLPPTLAEVSVLSAFMNSLQVTRLSALYSASDKSIGTAFVFILFFISRIGTFIPPFALVSACY